MAHDVRVISNSEITINSPEDDFLNSTYQNINGILWQMPAFGFALFGGILAGAFAINASSDYEPFGLPKSLLTMMTLLGGSCAMAALARAIYRAREYQAAAMHNIPDVLRRSCGLPGANVLFQGLILLCSFSLLGIAFSFAAEALGHSELSVFLFSFFLITGLLFWAWVECTYCNFRSAADKWGDEVAERLRLAREAPPNA